MKPLAPDLFDRRFDDLLELGRSKLPALSPDWTDHNAHDPGITLMELLAWVAEAEMYSLARTRRDERTAYAALLGVLPAGTRPARGLLWRDPTDAQSPAATFESSVVIGRNAVVHTLGADKPTYRPEYAVLWAPGQLTGLRAQLADGTSRDLTAVNARGGVEFMPFGEAAGPRDVLRMDYECRSDRGLFPANRAEADNAFFVIGVRTNTSSFSAADGSVDELPERTWLVATLESDSGRFPLKVRSDSTYGFLQTGALALDVSGIPDALRRFTIEISAPRGFARPPRVTRIEPNVLPIVQGRAVAQELDNKSTGEPDLSFDLPVAGLQFVGIDEPVQVEVDTEEDSSAWRRCDRLQEQGPLDTVFELDRVRERITFGNGINGRVPPKDAVISVAYAVCDGTQGAIARNRRWHVDPFAFSFGVNLDAVSSGTDATSFVDQRREARRRVREEHPLVSRSDLENAALALPLLEVARAWVVPLLPGVPQTNTVTLVALRARPCGKEPDPVPETSGWLAAIRRRLAPRMPLGTRLSVIAPLYTRFHLEATVFAAQGRDPATVKSAVLDALRKRTALVKSGSVVPREPGVPISRREVIAWIRAVDGVDHVNDVRLALEGGVAPDELPVARRGLPRLDDGATEAGIEVKRASAEIAA